MTSTLTSRQLQAQAFGRLRAGSARPRQARGLYGGVLAVGLALILTVPLLALRDHLSTANLALIYLLPVLAGATVGGLVPGVVASVVCVLAFDVLFIQPYGTLSVASAQDLVTLLLYLGVGTLVAELAARARSRAEEAARRAAANALLYELSGALLAGDLPQILDTLTERISCSFGLRSCAVLLPDERGLLSIHGQWGAPLAAAGLEDERQIAAVADWAFKQGEIVSLSLHRPDRFTGRVRRARREADPPNGEGDLALFVPLHAAPPGAGSQAAGLLRLVRPAGRALEEEETRLLTTFGTQAALAIERVQLVAASAEAAVLRESDRAKSIVLSNVSHDLRSPLTTIRGAAESLLQPAVAADSQIGRELLESIRDEADRLTALVTNLLNLSRLEAGALRPERHLYDLAEIAGGVLARLAPRLSGFVVHSEMDPSLGPVLVDYTLIDQVLVNLLDNAAKFAPAGSTIGLSLVAAGDEAMLTVADTGPGIPPEEVAHVFERFRRLQEAVQRGVPGTGLGLAICRAVVEAHHGRIWIEPNRPSGTRVCVALPRPTAADLSGGLEEPAP